LTKKPKRQSVRRLIFNRITFKGEQVEKFTYTWGEFSDKKFGRTLLLTGETGNRTLSYLNDQLNDGQIVTTVKEPRADMAANMINGLSADGSWNAEDPTYVLQLVWRDSFIVKWVIKKKKLTPDTVPMRIPLARRDTIGVDSCLYYAYTFVNGASSKEAQKATDIKRNIVKADTTYLPKLDDPKKNDTIVKYTVTEGVRVPLSVVDYASWNISGISVKKDVQSMDVVVGEKDKDPETLSMSEYKYNGTTGSFVLNSLTYSFNPKH